MVISTLWRVMAALLQKIERAQMQLQLGLLAMGQDLVSGSDLPYWCVNSVKARILGKGRLLNCAAGVVYMAKRFLKGEPIAALNGLFLAGVELPFYMLTGRKNLGLSGPHRTQWLIF